MKNDVEIPTTSKWSYGRFNAMALPTNHADFDGAILALGVRLTNPESNVNIGNNELSAYALGHTV